MNTLFTVGRSLRWARSSLRRFALTIDARLHLNLILWALRRYRRRSRRCCSILRWAFLLLCRFDVNHFAIAMIAPDWVVTFVCVGARIGAQGWSRDVPRAFLFHLEKSGQVVNYQVKSSRQQWRQIKLMKFHRKFFNLDNPMAIKASESQATTLRAWLVETTSLRTIKNGCGTNGEWKFHQNSIKLKIAFRQSVDLMKGQSPGEWWKSRCWFSTFISAIMRIWLSWFQQIYLANRVIAVDMVKTFGKGSKWPVTFRNKNQVIYWELFMTCLAQYATAQENLKSRTISQHQPSL